MPAAASLAAKIRAATGTEASLVKGGGGVFDVTVDDRLVYSKFETHQFPDEAELAAHIAALQQHTGGT